jgi:signal transduction histidine kinase/CheY-like chemotaxis protein
LRALEAISANQALPRWLEGRGEAAALIRSLDWSSTPLGPPGTWPDSLRAAIGICLGSRFPIVLWWGRDLVQIYNDAARPLVGTAKHPGAMGRCARDSWREVWDVVGPLLEPVLDTGDAISAEDQLLMPNRNGYPEECYFTFANGPIRDESGGVGGIFTVVAETTRRVLAERRLRALYEVSVQTLEARHAEHACALSAQVLGGHADDLPWALLYLLDETGREARLAARWGDAPEHAPVLDLQAAAASRAAVDSAALVPSTLARVSGTGADEVLADLRGLSVSSHPETGGQSALVLPMAAPPGSRPVGLLVAGISPHLALDDDYRAFLRTVAARVGHAAASARAYDRERRARQDATRASRLKDEFVATVAHELRGPLQAIKSALYVARERSPAHEGLAAALRSIDNAVAQQVRLVNDLMDMSRLERGRLEVRCRPVDLRAAAESALAAIMPAARAQGLEVELAEGRPAPVLADPDRLQQMIWNLLSNAVKFSDRRGRVRVVVERVDREMRLSVTDSGCGIRPEFLPHLFERFSQERSLHRGQRGEGLGLGLAIVRQLAELQGGAVEAQSRGPGQGSTFTLRFPVPPLAAGAGAPASEPSLSADPLSGVRVLVVEDETIARDTLLAVLGGWGAMAVGAESVPQALAQMPRLRPHLVVSDLSLPGEDGYSLVRKVRGLSDEEGGPPVPMIALSALGPTRGRDALGAGFDAFLAKPADPAELLDVLRRLRPPAA